MLRVCHRSLFQSSIKTQYKNKSSIEKFKKKLKMSKPIMVVVFSACAVVIGFISIGLQLGTLILYKRISNFVYVNYDVVAAGIWCGFIYIGAGSQGIFSSYKRPKSLRMTTALAAVAFCGAIVTATLSGMVASAGFSYSCNSYNYSNSCNPWQDMEWALMAFSIIAGFNHLTLMYYANVARRSDKCGTTPASHRQNESEFTGPYVIYGRNERQNNSRRDSLH